MWNASKPLTIHFWFRLSITILKFSHICWQVTGKEWHRVRNADVSRWLTLGQHWWRWVLLSFHAFVRPSNHPWAWVCVLHTKRLEEMAYNLACWWIQMAYTQQSWMLMDIVVGLRLGLGQRRAVVIIGRWLLPSLVDTGDICCHYWQHTVNLTFVHLVLSNNNNKITCFVLQLVVGLYIWLLI